MINYDTILSSFDDRGTLLKWLKTVEESLKNASLSTIDKIVLNDEQFKLSFKFADGSSIESPIIESGKIDVYKLLSLIEADNGVVVDEAEEGGKIEIHLDADVIAKLERALLIPLNSFDGKRLIGVDGQSKTQIQIDVDESLKIDGSTSPHTIGVNFVEFNGQTGGTEGSSAHTFDFYKVGKLAKLIIYCGAMAQSKEYPLRNASLAGYLNTKQIKNIRSSDACVVGYATDDDNNILPCTLAKHVSGYYVYELMTNETAVFGASPVVLNFDLIIE